MSLSNLVSMGDLLFKVFADTIKNILSLIYNYYSHLIETIFYYQKLFFFLSTIGLIYIVINFIWKYKENISRFLWLPEPIMGGILLNTFGQFFHNHLTDGLLELQKFLSNLPTTNIIVIIGKEDEFSKVITSYKNDYISWMYINNSIYLYINFQEDVKFVVNFLNKMSSKQLLNSLVIKTNIKNQINEDLLKTIAMCSGLKLPLYLVYENLCWCEYMWSYFDRNEIFGFLFDKNIGISPDIINKELYNLKLYILENMLKNNNFYLDFLNDFEGTIKSLTESIMNVYNGNYNFLRGVFFTTNENKVNLEGIFKIQEENKSYFIGFYSQIIEKEVLLSKPYNNVFASRSNKYRNNIFVIALLLTTLYFIKMNINLMTFKKDFESGFKEFNNFINIKKQQYLKNNKNILSEELKDYQKKDEIYEIYKLLNIIDNTNLKPIYYKYFPHIYFVGYLYNELASIEEKLIFKLLELKTNFANLEIVEKNEDDDEWIQSFQEFQNYVKKVLDLEDILLSNTSIVRFGVIRKTNKNNKNLNDLLSVYYEDLRATYFLLFKKFVKSYCNDNILNEVENLNKQLNNLFRQNQNHSISQLQNIISSFYELNKNLLLKNSKLKNLTLNILLERIKKSIIFGEDIFIETNNILQNNLKKHYLELIAIKNPIIGNILLIENDKFSIDTKCANIINDISKFLQEPFMEVANNNGPQMPTGMVSSWNLYVLKDTLNIRNKFSDFKKKINDYSSELHNVFLNIFQYKIGESIFNKIGISQNLTSLESLNIQNLIDAFDTLNILLNFFLELGATTYYNNLLNILYHDITLVDKKIEESLKDSIFYSYKTIKFLKKDNIQEFLTNSTKQNKIKVYLDTEVDSLIELYNTYIIGIMKILSTEHFKKYRGTQYNKYISISNEIKKYEKGLDNSIQKFTKFILDLKDYSIYNSYFENFNETEGDGFLDDLLNNLKIEIIAISQKLYMEELILNYDNMIKDFHTFAYKFPFNKTFNENNCVEIENLCVFLEKYKKIIEIFNKNTLINKEILKNIKKFASLIKGIKKDTDGYFYNGKIEYNIDDKFSKHNKYIGLVVINQTNEYYQYLLQEEIKLYFQNPIYIHIEIANMKAFKLLNNTNDYFKVKANKNGITIRFNNFWHFYHYLQIHKENQFNDMIVIISIPIIYENSNSNIRFAIKFKDFIFFPSKLIKFTTEEK